MKTSAQTRFGIGLLLLGLSLKLVVSFAREPDHYLEHSTSSPTGAEERVTLHTEDGDHHHETARLELGESLSHASCELCAQIGKAPALLIKRLGLVATLDPSSRPLPDVAFLHASPEKGPQQPRAPPHA